VYSRIHGSEGPFFIMSSWIRQRKGIYFGALPEYSERRPAINSYRLDNATG
jgi:hypothetical protein